MEILHINFDGDLPKNIAIALGFCLIWDY